MSFNIKQTNIKNIPKFNNSLKIKEINKKVNKETNKEKNKQVNKEKQNNKQQLNISNLAEKNVGDKKIYYLNETTIPYFIKQQIVYDDYSDKWKLKNIYSS